MRKGHRITLKQPVMSQDSTGQPVITMTKYATRWADQADSAGSELMRRNQIDAIVSGTFRIDFPKDGRVPQPEDQVTWTEPGPNGESRTGELVLVQREENRQRSLLLHFKEDA